MRTAIRLTAAAFIATLALGAVTWGGTVLADVYIFFEVTPEFASAPLHRTHTVTATPILEQNGSVETYEHHEYVGVQFHFRVIYGPNEGRDSRDGGCVPVDCVGGFNEVVHPVSWSYVGSGGVGTDTILVCGEEIRTEIPVGTENFEECETVFMSWFGGSLPALGSVISDQAAENRARANAAAAPAAPPVTAPRTGTGVAVTPPNTGDGGLLARESASPLPALAAIAAAGAMLAVTARSLRRR
jgi:hypothetical protein